MKKTILSLCAVLFLAVGCSKSEPATLQFESKTYQANEGDKAKIKLAVLEAKGNEESAKSFNAAVLTMLKEIIYFGEKPFGSTSYQALANDFVQAYRDLKQEFPQDSFGFEADVKSAIAYQDEHRINLVMDHYTYTGGAHGYGTTTSLHFDAQTGKQVSVKQFFSDWNGLVKLAEAKFRAQHQLEANSSLNEGGFMFEDDQFWLSENMQYDAKGLTVIYNPYDIAAYVEGVIKLELTPAEIAPYIKN